MTPEELSCFLYRLLLCTESPLRFSGVIAIHEIQTLHNVTWTELKAERINSGDKFASEKVLLIHKPRIPAARPRPQTEQFLY